MGSKLSVICKVSALSLKDRVRSLVIHEELKVERSEFQDTNDTESSNQPKFQDGSALAFPTIHSHPFTAVVVCDAYLGLRPLCFGGARSGAVLLTST